MLATSAFLILKLSHFSAVAIFAALASVVFGITLREHPREQIRYGLFCFASFLVATIVAGWIMFLINSK